MAPSAPAGPGGPCSPTAPSAPAGPDGPTTPSAPAGPGGPCGPIAPSAPAGPGGPTAPSAPAGPAGPTSPRAPWGPTAPAGPGNPTTPAGPCGPTSPTGPARPWGPEAPGGRRTDRTIDTIGTCGSRRARRAIVTGRTLSADVTRRPLQTYVAGRTRRPLRTRRTRWACWTHDALPRRTLRAGRALGARRALGAPLSGNRERQVTRVTRVAEVVVQGAASAIGTDEWLGGRLSADGRGCSVRAAEDDDQHGGHRDRPGEEGDGGAVRCDSRQRLTSLRLHLFRPFPMTPGVSVPGPASGGASCLSEPAPRFTWRAPCSATVHLGRVHLLHLAVEVGEPSSLLAQSPV
jgi:hypothetical protein